MLNNLLFINITECVKKNSSKLVQHQCKSIKDYLESSF